MDVTIQTMFGSIIAACCFWLAQSISAVGSLTGTNATHSGTLILPKAAQTFSYDLDGNITNDGIWSYEWDGENRLKAMTMATNISGLVASNRLRLEFAYDYQGRRFSKTVYDWSVAETNFVATSTNLFIYDGWNLIAELTGGAPLDPLPLLRSYMWGLDLADSFEEAGGIGGLLVFSDHVPATNTYHHPTYDGNRNVTGLVQSSGSPTALYEYSPFGELIRTSGPASLLNPFQFSTKYLDQETGLSYYGHRYYSASLGKWINRDPIEEEDGPNLYAFVSNRPLTLFGAFGLNSNLTDLQSTQAIEAKMQGDGWMTLRKVYTEAKEFQQNAADFADMWNLVMDCVDGDPSDLIMEIVNARRDIAKMSNAKEHSHHSLPQRMRGIFEKAGIEIDRDKFVKGVSKIIHKRLHGGKGFDNKLENDELGRKGGMWNFMWRAFMGKESNRTDQKAIEQFSDRMLSFFGIP
jgi:RHS repeat-associated protein